MKPEPSGTFFDITINIAHTVDKRIYLGRTIYLHPKGLSTRVKSVTSSQSQLLRLTTYKQGGE